MRMLRVRDVELCVDEFGDPAHPLVLLVGGAAASMDWWDVGFCEAIAAGGRRVVRYDHRDTGRSTTDPAGAPTYGGEALERDCVALVEALGLGPAHLVGLSMGGGIAQSVACHRPEVVSALTLVATSPLGGVEADLPGVSPEVAALFDDPPPDPDWTDRDAVVAWHTEADRAFSGRLFDEQQTRDVAGQVFDRSLDPAAASNHWLLTGDGGEPVDVRRITAPTLVVHGTDDPLFPLPHGEALAAAIPGARLLVVEGMGHQVPPPESWPDVVPAILAVASAGRGS